MGILLTVVSVAGRESAAVGLTLMEPMKATE
jgi:hypothetical protein